MTAPAVDFSALKFGKLRPRLDPRTLRLQDYLTGLPVAPAAVSWDKGQTAWGMMGNDRLGDCTCAAMGHAEQVITANAQAAEITVPDSAVLTAYEAVSGYNPQTGANDNGADMLTVCNYWKSTGIGGHKAAAFVSCPRSQAMIELAIDLFGYAYIGFEVPNSAMQQIGAGQPWSVVTPDGGIVGGHCIVLVDYDASGPTCVTWGQLQKMSWQFLQTYCDEAYAVISQEWVAANGSSPSGLNWAALQSDLAQLGGAPAPTPTPTPVWRPDPSVVAGLTWELQVAQYLAAVYPTGDVADATKWQQALASYAPGLAAYMAGGTKHAPFLPARAPVVHRNLVERVAGFIEEHA